MVVIPLKPPPSPDIVPGCVGVLCGMLTVVAQALGHALDGVKDHIAKTGLDHLGKGLESLGKHVPEHSCSVQPFVALITLKHLF